MSDGSREQGRVGSPRFKSFYIIPGYQCFMIFILLLIIIGISIIYYQDYKESKQDKAVIIQEHAHHLTSRNIEKSQAETIISELEKGIKTDHEIDYLFDNKTFVELQLHEQNFWSFKQRFFLRSSLLLPT